MIEFYQKYFQKNYVARVNQLISDLSRLLFLEGIAQDECLTPFLDEKYNNKIEEIQWKKLNDLYFTIENHSHRISHTLNKFVNKKASPRNYKFKFIDTFAGCGGLSLGLKNAGFSPVLVNEIEPRYLETYYFNHDLPMDSYYCGDIGDLVDDCV